MVVVRSMMTFKCNDGEIEARKRKHGRDAVHGLDHVGAGLAENRQEYAGLPPKRPEVADVLDGINDLGDIPEANRRALMARDDQGLIFVRLEELVGIARIAQAAGDRRERPSRDLHWRPARTGGPVRD